MIDGLKPYSQSKESGLPWLGAIPAHWEVRRMKSSASNVIEQTIEMRNDDVYVSLEDVESWTGRVRPKRGQNLFKGQVKRFLPGDVLFGKLRPYLAKVARLPVQGVCVGELFVLRSRYAGLRSSFLEQQLRAKQTIDVINSSTFGAKMPRADWQFVGNLSIAVPPREEQDAIVRFLGHANGRIERAIRAKKKLMTLLNEQKQVVIHRVVTRGLNPNVPLKPSGIPWLGDIPKHWEVARSRRLFSVRTELARKEDIQLSATQAYGVIPQAEYEEKVGRRVVKISMHLEKRKHVEKDDFVISMRSFEGGIERSWASGAIRSSYVVMKPDECVDITFYSYVLKSPGYIRALQATGDFIRDGQDLTYANFRMVDLPLMPLPEQQKIARFVESATKQLDASVARAEREIELLREYRTRLVADVVTGKLDVRAAANKIPAVESEFQSSFGSEELSETETEEAEA